MSFWPLVFFISFSHTHPIYLRHTVHLSHCCQHFLSSSTAEIVVLWSKRWDQSQTDIHVNADINIMSKPLHVYVCSLCWTHHGVIDARSIFCLFLAVKGAQIPLLLMLTGINEVAAKQAEGPSLDGTLSSIVWIHILMHHIVSAERNRSVKDFQRLN